MFNYGVSPRTGNAVRVLRCVSRQPLLFRCKVTTADRSYYTNYLERKMYSMFDPVSRRNYRKACFALRQYKIQFTYDN